MSTPSPDDRDFSRTHPDYDRMLLRWIMAYDFFRGGAHVLQPAQKVGTVSWQIPTHPEEDGTGPSHDTPRTSDSQFSWYSAPVNSYLWKHERERIEEYRRRTTSAYHLPLFRPLCNLLASAVLKTGPERKSVGASWEYYFSDVDMAGTPIASFMRQALVLGLVFGRIHAITDMGSGNGSPIVSLADQRASGIRAYSYLVTPFDLVNWALDERGNFVWAVVREDIPDVRAPGQKMPEERDQYRVWYRDRWELWAKIKQDVNGPALWVMLGTGPNPLGRVPIQTLYCHRGSRTLFGCESPLADVVDVDRSVLNKCSLLDESIAKGTFAILAVPRRDGGPIADIEVGPGTGLMFDAEAGPPLYVSPDTALIATLWQVIRELIAATRVASEIGRGAAEQSIESRSAAAIGAESSDKHNVMSSLAEAVEQFERGLYADVSGWEGSTDVPTVAYSRKFDLRSVNQQITDLVQFKAAGVSTEAREIMARPVVGKFMAELGATDEERAEAMSAATVEDEPAAPRFGAMPLPVSEDEAAQRRGEVA